MYIKIPRAQVYWNAGMTAVSFMTILKGKMLRGQAVQEFEKALSLYLGTRYVILTSCGKISLYLCIKALDLKIGDEIIVPAFTVPEVVEVLLVCGLIPVFIDIDQPNLNIDSAHIERNISEKTKAILATHLYGNPCNLDAILIIAEKHKIIVIEDAAQAIGAEYKNKRVGTIGKVGYYSFGMMKHFNTLGGSAIVTNDASLYNKILTMNSHYPYPKKRILMKALLIAVLLNVITNKYVFSLCGFPLIRLFRLFGNTWLYQALAGRPVKKKYAREFLEREKVQFANMQGLTGIMQLRLLDENNEKRMKNAALLDQTLNIPGKSYATNIYSQYVMLFKNREKVIGDLLNNGIDVTNGYLENCALRFSDNQPDNTWPNSTQAESNNLYIPIHPSLDEQQMRYIATCLKEIV